VLAVRAVVGWWSRHPWLVWWVLPLIVAALDTLAIGARVPWIWLVLRWIVVLGWMASFAQGLRVTWRSERARAVAAFVFFVLAAIPPMMPFPMWIMNVRGEPVQSAALLAAVVAGALIAEIVVRRRTGSAAVTTPAASPTGRTLLVRLSVKIGLILLGIVLFAGYAGAKLGWAERQAERVCTEAAPGAAVDRVRERAQRLGLLVGSVPESKHEGKARQPARVMAFEGVAFDRWFCNVEHESGKVVRAWTNRLD